MTDSTGWQSPGGEPSLPPPRAEAVPPTPAQQGWTPPPKPGLIPLRPLSFGTLLGASFQVMRRNPRPTFGVAVLLNGITSLLFIAVFAVLAVFAFGRISTATSGDVGDIAAGSIGILALAGFIPLAIAIVTAAVMQGVISLEVARATLGEKLRLPALLALARGRVWALIGWAFLVSLSALVGVGIVALAVGAIAATGGAAGVAFAILLGLLFAFLLVALYSWIGTRVSLVPSILMLERLTLRRAIARSWSLTNGYFWKTLGIQLLIAVIVQVAVQIVTTPITFVGTMIATLISPNGDSTSSAAVLVAVYVIAAIASIIIGAITTVMQSASIALIYIDLRMRKEGLDLDLIQFVESRQAGSTSVADPYATSRHGAAHPVTVAASAPGFPPTDSPWA